MQKEKEKQKERQKRASEGREAAQSAEKKERRERDRTSERREDGDGWPPDCATTATATATRASGRCKEIKTLHSIWTANKIPLVEV